MFTQGTGTEADGVDLVVSVGLDCPSASNLGFMPWADFPTASGRYDYAVQEALTLNTGSGRRRRIRNSLADGAGGGSRTRTRFEPNGILSRSGESASDAACDNNETYADKNVPDESPKSPPSP